MVIWSFRFLNPIILLVLGKDGDCVEHAAHVFYRRSRSTEQPVEDDRGKTTVGRRKGGEPVGVRKSEHGIFIFHEEDGVHWKVLFCRDFTHFPS